MRRSRTDRSSTRRARLDVVHDAVLLPPVGRCVKNVTTREGNRDDQPGAQHEQFERADIDARHLNVNPEGTPVEVATDSLARHIAHLSCRPTWRS